MLRRLKRLILWNWWSYFFFSNIARLNYPNLSQIFLRLLDMHHCISIPSYEDFTCAGGAKFMIRKTEGVGGNIVYTGWDSTIFPAKPVSALLSLFFWNFWSWHESISFSVYLFKSLNLPWRLGERCVKKFHGKNKKVVIFSGQVLVYPGIFTFLSNIVRESSSNFSDESFPFLPFRT